MNRNILWQLYKGEVYPSENIIVKDPKYAEINSAISEEKKYFLNMLPENDRNRFKKLDDLYYNASAMLSYENFSHGFSLAVALLIEALNGTDEITRNTDK